MNTIKPPAPFRPDAATRESLVGQILDSQFLVLEPLGTWSMGHLYLGRDTSTGRHVAVETLDPSLAHDREVSERFIQQGDAVGRLGHPNLPTSIAVGRSAFGDLYRVNDLVERSTLAQRIATKGPLAAIQAVHVAKQIAAGLAAAHANGVIHGDLTSDRILLVDRPGDPNIVRIVGFGVTTYVSPIGSRANGKAASAPNFIVGTPGFLAPEQLEVGIKAGTTPGAPVDTRADIYALGAILYHMIVGQPPRASLPLSQASEQAATSQCKPLHARADLPRGLAALIEQLLAKSPSNRPASMAQLVPQLDSLRSAAWAPTLPAVSVPASSTTLPGIAPTSVSPPPPPLPPLPPLPNIAMGTGPTEIAPAPALPLSLRESGPTQGMTPPLPTAAVPVPTAALAPTLPPVLLSTPAGSHTSGGALTEVDSDPYSDDAPTIATLPPALPAPPMVTGLAPTSPPQKDAKSGNHASWPPTYAPALAGFGSGVATMPPILPLRKRPSVTMVTAVLLLMAGIGGTYWRYGRTHNHSAVQVTMPGWETPRAEKTVAETAPTEAPAEQAPPAHEAPASNVPYGPALPPAQVAQPNQPTNPPSAPEHVAAMHAPSAPKAEHAHPGLAAVPTEMPSAAPAQNKLANTPMPYPRGAGRRSALARERLSDSGPSYGYGSGSAIVTFAGADGVDNPAAAQQPGVAPAVDGQSPQEPAAPPTPPAPSPQPQANRPPPGSLDRDQVRQTIAGNFEDVRTCHARESMQPRPDQPAIAGRMLVRIQVGPSGAVENAQVVESSLGRPKLEGCIIEAVGRWRFPAPSGNVAGSVIVPFAFD